MAPVVLSGAYLQRAGVFSLQQPMPPGIKPPQHCASPESFRLDADSTTVFLFRNPSHLHSVLRIPQNIIRLQPLHFSYEKGRRVLSLRPDPGANCHYGSLTLAELGMAFWHDLAAPVIAGILASMIVNWLNKRK